MINKLDVILELNDQAKKNDVYKERLHQNLREYLSWKNSLFKQNVLNKTANSPFEPNFSRLFTNNGKKNGILDYGKLDPDDIINNADGELDE